MKKSLALLVTVCYFTLFSTAQVWVPKADYPAVMGGDGSLFFTIGNKIYLGGGFQSKSFYEYDVAANTWTQKNNLPGVADSRAFGTGFAINGKGYAGFGLDITNGVPNCLTDLWEYDPSNDQWTQKAPYPGTGCDAHFSFVVNNRAYVGGGEVVHTGSKKDMYEYDPATNTWTQKADYPDPAGVVSPFCFLLDNKAYISCGVQATEGKKTYAYDPATNTWEAKADFPNERQAGSAFVLYGKAYCGWGYAGNTFYQDFWEYDQPNDTWVNNTVSPGSGRGFSSAVACNERIFAGLGWSIGAIYHNWWEITDPTSIGDVPGQAEINIYPNPAGDNITVDGMEAGETYCIYSIAGQKIESGILKGKKIYIGELPKGQYILELTSKDQIVKRKIGKL